MQIEFEAFAKPKGKPQWSEDTLREKWVKAIQDEKKKRREERRMVEFNENGFDAMDDILKVIKPGREYTRGDISRRCQNILGKNYSPVALKSVLRSLLIAGKLCAEKLDVGHSAYGGSSEMSYRLKG